MPAAFASMIDLSCSVVTVHSQVSRARSKSVPSRAPPSTSQVTTMSLCSAAARHELEERRVVVVREHVAERPETERRFAPVVAVESAHERRGGLPVLRRALVRCAKRRAIGGAELGERQPIVERQLRTELRQRRTERRRAGEPFPMARLVARHGRGRTVADRVRLDLDAAVLRMRRLAVVALEVVLHGELPVRAHREGLAMRDARVGDAVQTQVGNEALRQRRPGPDPGPPTGSRRRDPRRPGGRRA